MEIKSHLRNKELLKVIRSFKWRFTLKNNIDKSAINFSLETKRYKNEYKDPFILVSLFYYSNKPYSPFCGFEDIDFRIYRGAFRDEDQDIAIVRKVASAFQRLVYPEAAFFNDEQLNLEHGQWYRYEVKSSSDESVLLVGDARDPDDTLGFSLRFDENKKFLMTDRDVFKQYFESIFIAIDEAVESLAEEQNDVV